MKRAVCDRALSLGLHWAMLVIASGLFVLVATFVDLKPVVDQNFFFSTNDPGILQTKKIERRFPSQPEVILAVSSRSRAWPKDQKVLTTPSKARSGAGC